MREDFANVLESAFTKIGDKYKLTDADEFVRCTTDILSNDPFKIEEFIEFMMKYTTRNDIKLINKALDDAILGINKKRIAIEEMNMKKKEKIKDAIEEAYMYLVDEKTNTAVFSEKVSSLISSVRKKFPNSDNEIMEALDEIGLIDKRGGTELIKAFEFLAEVDNQINSMSEDELKDFAAESVVRVYEARREKMVKDSIELMLMRFNKDEMKKFIEDKKYAEENNLFLFALSLPSNVITALLCMEMEFKNDPTYVMKHNNDKYIVVDPKDYYKWREDHERRFC